MTATRSKALGYLRGGRVRVITARSTPVELVAYEVVARVDGHRGAHVVTLRRGEWSCSCRDAQGCAHAAAVQLVTGHTSAAAKPETGPRGEGGDDAD